MKCFIRILAGFAILAANMGAAVYVAIITAPGHGQADWAALLDKLEQRRWPAFALAVVLFLTWLLFFWARNGKRSRERFLTFDSEEGPVSISTLAIADFIMKLTAEFPSVVRIEPHIMPHRRTIDVLLNVHVKAGTQINEMCQLLQQRVRQNLIDEMGIPDVNRIKVNIKGITGEHRVFPG